MKTIIAIDPGQKGAVAVLSAGVAISVYNCPGTGIRGIVDLLSEIKSGSSGKDFAAIMEDVHSMPMDGSKAAFSFGRNIAAYELSCYFLDIPLRLVTPQAWQKHYKLPPKDRSKKRSEQKTAHKNALKAEAMRLFPEHKITLQNSDALLILDYAIHYSELSKEVK